MPGATAHADDGGAAAAWKTSLGALGRPRPTAPATTPLGLHFELREQLRPARGRWEKPESVPAKAACRGSEQAGRPVYRLAVRPVLLSPTRNWVRGSLTWASLPYQLHRLRLDVEQHRWFGQFATLHKALHEPVAAAEGPWLHLDDFASPLLWPLFELGARLGIAWVTGARETAVEFGSSGQIRLDIRSADGALVLDPRVVIDEVEHRAATVGLIGDHGFYVWGFGARPQLLLAPSARRIDGDRRRVLAGEIIIPAADADEFLRDYSPGLRATVDVVSGDDSVRLPELPSPTRAAAPRELTGAPRLVVTTVETGHRDWFDLGVLVTVEGQTIPFGPLFAALTRRQSRLRLVDNTYLSLAHPAFDALRRLIDEARDLDEWETGLRINRHQAALWQEFEELADETVQAAAWRSSVAGLRAAAAGELRPTPAGVTATLRPYQAEGYSWLTFLYEHRLGAVLADDMGLGKTLQLLALMVHAQTRPHGDDAAGADPRRPFLVVAPTSVVSNWVDEAARFTPGLRVVSLSTTQASARRTAGAETLHQLVGRADVVVTSYALFRLDFERYQAESWAGLILDEAQFVKNRSSRLHRCAVELRAPFKVAVTGTPMENNLLDLWSLFRIVAPGLLATRARFAETYAKPIALGDRPELLARLRRRIRPFLLRRTKELVAVELPAIQEQVLRVDLAPEHRARYDVHLQRERQKLLGLLDDEHLDRSTLIVFRSLTLLRLLALDASLVDDDAAGVPSAKLDLLLDELDAVIAGGHRALVFSQFTSFLARVAERLEQRGIAHAVLDGSTRRRSEVIDGFKQGVTPVFLISLKAGGFGLNLTEADYVFLLDPWWNPATEAQAIDRTHRIGQTKNVTVYRMIANDTIEEKVLALSRQKARLIDAVIDDDRAAFSSALTAADLQALLSD